MTVRAVLISSGLVSNCCLHLEEVVNVFFKEPEVVLQATTIGLLRIRLRSDQHLALALFFCIFSCRTFFSCGSQYFLDVATCLVFIYKFNLKYSTLYCKRVRGQLLLTKYKNRMNSITNILGVIH